MKTYVKTVWNDQGVQWSLIATGKTWTVICHSLSPHKTIFKIWSKSRERILARTLGELNHLGIKGPWYQPGPWGKTLPFSFGDIKPIFKK